MDFKKLFSNDKAVSPVIGVILMVAITVILAAAIGSSVFGEGTAESAPQANLDMKAVSVGDATAPPAIRIEHLGGDDVHFSDSKLTKITASVNGGPSVEVNADGNPDTGDYDNLGTMSVGDAKKLELEVAAGVFVDEDTSATATTDILDSGDTVNIKIIDVQTNQLICDKDIRF